MQHNGFWPALSDLSHAGGAARAERTQQRLSAHPRCGVARFLAGCMALDRNRPAIAVQHFMIAHHAEPDLEAAALLVFAGLSWVPRRARPLLPVLLETWEEFRRPKFDRRPRERALLDALATPLISGLDRLSPLAQRLWRLPISSLQTQLAQAVDSRESDRFRPLLVSA